jgi:structural maintenance of chromosome 1
LGDWDAIASTSPWNTSSLEHKADYEKFKAEAEEAAEQQTLQLNRRRGINSEVTLESSIRRWKWNSFHRI